jgi:hypothetical protein
MSWTRTQAWWAIVLEVVDEIEVRTDGTLPWKQRYAEVFPEPGDLYAALRYYWQLVVAAQPDVSRSIGLRLVLERSIPRAIEALTDPIPAHPGRADT